MNWQTWAFLALNLAFWLSVAALIVGFVIEEGRSAFTVPSAIWLSLSAAMIVGTIAFMLRL